MIIRDRHSSRRIVSYVTVVVVFIVRAAIFILVSLATATTVNYVLKSIAPARIYLIARSVIGIFVIQFVDLAVVVIVLTVFVATVPSEILNVSAPVVAYFFTVI